MEYRRAKVMGGTDFFTGHAPSAIAFVKPQNVAWLRRSPMVLKLWSGGRFVEAGLELWAKIGIVIHVYYEMNAHPLLKVDIAELSISERIQLAEDLWDSILENSEELPLTNAQQQELDRRLEQYNRNPSLGADWNAVKSRLGFGNEL